MESLRRPRLSIGTHERPFRPVRAAHRSRRRRRAAPRPRARALVALVALVVLGALTAFAVVARARLARSRSRWGSPRRPAAAAPRASGITANGYVVARTKASVSAKILGRLSWIGVSEGSLMKAGDIIARLEDADYRPRWTPRTPATAQVEAQLAQARRDLVARAGAATRESRLRFRPRGGTDAVDVLVAQLNSARAQATLAEVSLENTRVRRAVRGHGAAQGRRGRRDRRAVFGRRRAHAHGDRHHGRPAHARGRGRRQRGVHRAGPRRAGARITLDAYPDTSFSGRVRQVVPTADRQKATVLVKVSILDHDPRILPEMGAKVVFESKGAARCGGAASRAGVRRRPSCRAPMARSSGWSRTSACTASGVDVGATRGDQVEIRAGPRRRREPRAAAAAPPCATATG